jgi:hypothetical protein
VVSCCASVIALVSLISTGKRFEQAEEQGKRAARVRANTDAGRQLIFGMTSNPHSPTGARVSSARTTGVGFRDGRAPAQGGGIVPG